jgi:hypothetical protein
MWDEYRREKAMCEAACSRQGVREKFVATLRAGLTRAGIDPAAVPAMCLYEPGGVFAPRPEPPSRPPPDGPAERLRAKLLRIVDHHREHPIDLATATPMELFAVYCFVPDAPGVAYLRPEIG